MTDTHRRGPAGLWAVALALLLSGCLPSSQRENDRSLAPADSASVRLAESVVADTLDVLWTGTAPDDNPMLLPTSLGWRTETDGSTPGLVVIDTQDNSLRLFAADGAYDGRTEIQVGESPAFPFLAGIRGDTVVVLARGADRLAWVLPGRGVVRTVPIPSGATAALATDSLLAVRLGGATASGVAPALARLDERGRVLAQHSLPGPAWRSTGFLRPWGASLLALSGYRPVVDLLPSDARPSAPLDTLALHGFDSPQLARSAQFMRGDVNEPPLLSSSAAALGDHLYVLNLRADHVRIDRYTEGGVLDGAFVSPGPWQPLTLVPVDLAVREGEDGALDIAVLMQRQSGIFATSGSQVVRYRWTPRSR